MSRYTAKVKYVVEGTIVVEAKNQKEAKETIEEICAGDLKATFDTTSDKFYNLKDWAIDINTRAKVCKIIKQKSNR